MIFPIINPKPFSPLTSSGREVKIIENGIVLIKHNIDLIVFFIVVEFKSLSIKILPKEKLSNGSIYIYSLT